MRSIFTFFEMHDVTNTIEPSESAYESLDHFGSELQGDLPHVLNFYPCEN